MNNKNSIIESEEILLPAYGILVATKDRPRQIEIFLESVCKQSFLPAEVVIVSAGIEINETIDNFNKKLNIKHVHSALSGQIIQKKIGLKYFSENLEWIAFFDDDIILFPDSIANIFTDISCLSINNNIAGMGFACNPNSTPVRKLRYIFLKKIFFSSDRNLGKVNKSGYNASYMDSRKIIETQWLNGISIWRADLARKYEVPFDKIPHAICEDLFFSYNNLKYGKLFFSPSSQFTFQKYPKQYFQLNTFVLHTYIQLFFVLTNKDLSVWAFYWKFLGSSINALVNTMLRIFKFPRDLLVVPKLFFDITSLVFTKKKASYILRSRINKKLMI